MTFGWKVPLFQRPQHIAKNMALQNCLVLYEVTTMTDKVEGIVKERENLYLVNFNNVLLKKELLKQLIHIDRPKYIQFYSTDCSLNINMLNEYINQGYKVIYEYIDDLNPHIVGRNELPKNIIDKYKYMINHKDDVIVVVTADEIKKDVIKNRGNENLVLATNGVDYEYFQNIDLNYKFDKTFEKILEEKKPIIGYYGALANWFDYELVKKIANERPNYNIVLIGVKYDESYEKSGVSKCQNVYFLGKRDYSILKNYANKFDVCTIPFKINDITKSTSPVKLFEYMALKKPIVTTDMNECQKYKSVCIGKNKDEILELIDKCINMKEKRYFELLDMEAMENDWSEKVKLIIKELAKQEK